MKSLMKSVLVFLALFVSASVASATVFYVTPSSALYPTPCQAIYAGASWSLGGPIAVDGDTIEIDYNNGIPYTEAPDANHAGRSDCKISQSNLTIIGVNGRAILDGSPSSGPLANTGIYYAQGLLMPYGHNITISNLEIRGATNSVGNANNGTGIMICAGGSGIGTSVNPDGGNVTIEYSFIHGNNDGVRSTAVGPGAEYYNSLNASTPPTITLQYDELADNGNDCVQTSCSHNTYFGTDTNAPPLGTATTGLTEVNVYYTWSHDAWVGMAIKDRNVINNFYYDLIGDAEGNTSNVLDFPLGGRTYVVGTTLYKTLAISTPQNNGNASKAFMTWADVGDNGSGDPEYGLPFQDLHFVNDTILLDPGVETPAFVVVGCQDANYTSCGAPANGPAVSTPAVVENNIFIGPTSAAINQTGAYVSNNLILANNTSPAFTPTPGTLDGMASGSNVTNLFVDAAHFNFNLKSTATTAIGQGLATPTLNDGATADPLAVAQYQYVHPSDASTRAAVTDLGAYQYASAFASPSGLTITNSGPVVSPGTGTITISGLPTTLSTIGGFSNADFWSEAPSVVGWFGAASSSSSSGVNAGPGGQDGVLVDGLYGTGEVSSATSYCDNALAPVDGSLYLGCPSFSGTLTTTFNTYAPSGGSQVVPVDVYVDGEHLTTNVTVQAGAVAVQSIAVSGDSSSSYATLVTLTNPPAAPITITLSSSDNTNGYLTFPASITIPAGQPTGVVNSAIGAIWGQTPSVEDVTLTATYTPTVGSPSSASVVVPLTAPIPRHFYFGTTTVVGGQTLNFDTGYTTDCPPAGCPYQIISSNPAAVPNQTITVQGGPPSGYADPPGSGSTGYFPSTLHTNTVLTVTSVTLSIMGNGSNCDTVTCPTPTTQVITVNPPGAGVPVYLLVAPSNSGAGQSAVIGTTFASPVVALVTDINSTPMAGVSVTFAGPGLLFPNGATAMTDASGLASVIAEPLTVGALTITATSTGIGFAPTFSETGLVGTGPATAITVVSGSGQTANVGLGFTNPLIVSVTGAGGVPVSGAIVTFGSSGATLTPSNGTVTTNSSGQATITASPSQSGTITITASTAGVGSTANFTETGFGSIWTVGPGQQFATPCPAIHAASPGDIIQVQYNNGVIYQEPLDPYPSPTNGSGAARNDCVWYTNGLTIEGVGGRPIMDGTGGTFQKAIYNPRGANETFINLEVRNTYCDTDAQGYNCAAIRVDAGSTSSPAGGNINVQYCYLHDNDNGMLTQGVGALQGGAFYYPTNSSNGTTPPFITMQYDELYNNGSQVHPGYEHNFYIGPDTDGLMIFNFEYSWSHDSAAGGHTVKTRNGNNNLYYDLIGDGVGNTSYVLDFPLGGSTYIVGSTLYKVATTNGNANRGFMLWADAGDNAPSDPEWSPPHQDLHFINNTVILDPGNDTQAYVLLACSASNSTTCPTPGNGPAITTNAVVQNNIFVGPNVEFVNQPTAVQSNNYHVLNNSTGGTPTAGTLDVLTNGSNVSGTTGLFVNPSAFNFNLNATAGSQAALNAIGKGMSAPTDNTGAADPKALAVYQFGNTGTFANGGLVSALADRPNVTDLGAFYNGVVVAAAPSSIVVGSGNNQSSTVGTNYASPLCAVVLDQNSHPFAGATVTLAGAGTLFPFGYTAITDSTGSACITAQPNAAGIFTVTATVNGYAGAGSASFTETGTNGASVGTTSVLTTTGTPSTYGVSVTFTDTVTEASGTATPTGMVQFSIDGSAVGGPVTLNSGGQGTYATSTLAVGSHSVTVVYTPSGSFTTSSATPLTQVVNQVSTTTVLASGTNPSTSGGSVTFTATVTPATATGTVTFMYGATTLCATAAMTSGVATCAYSALPVGTDAITAVYSGDLNDNGSTSSTLSQVVNSGSIATTTALTTSLFPSTYGQSVTFTATVSSGSGTPTGTVQFSINGSAVGSPVTLNSGGQGTYTTSTLAAGTYAVTAAYIPTGSFTASNGTLTGGQFVNKASANLTLTSTNGSGTTGVMPNVSADYSLTGFVGSDTQATSCYAGAPSVTTTATSSSPAGSYPITAAAGTLACSGVDYLYTIVIGSNAGVLTLVASGPQAQTITFPAIPYQSYGAVGTVFNPGATASSGLTVTYTVVYGPATVSGNGVMITGSGDITVTASQAGNTTYSAATPITRTFSVLQSGVSWPSPSTITYGTPASAFMTVQSTITTGTTVYSNGAQVLTPTTVLAAGKYSISAVFTSTPGWVLKIPLTLVVAPAPLTVTVNSLSVTYNSQVPASYSYSIAGFVNGDPSSVVTGVPTITTTATAKATKTSGVSLYTSPVGSYALNATTGSLKATNYTFTFVSGTLTITPATTPLTITATNVNIMYASQLPATYRYTVTGLLGFDSAASAGTGTPSITSTATTTSPAGTYPITAAAGTFLAPNYSGVIYVNGTANIVR